MIDENLRNAFPSMDVKERDRVRTEFYRHFSDLVIETIRTLQISSKELNERFIVTNPELLSSPEFNGRDLVLLTAHYGNWEWGAMQMSQSCPSRDAFGIYLPLKNKFFDDLVRNSRGRFGTELISTRKVSVISREKRPRQAMFAFIADQNPSNLNKSIWVPFFGREVPVAKGPEKFATELHAPVLYGHVRKVRRGHYTLTYELLANDASLMEEGTLSRLFMKKAEEQIRKRPGLWLWSHKRWKHKRKSGL